MQSKEKVYGTLGGMIKMVMNDERLKERLKTAFIIISSKMYSQTDIVESVSVLIAIAEYMTTITPAKLQEEFEIVTIGDKAVGKYEDLQYELHNIINHWDKLLAYKVKGSPESTISGCLAVIICCAVKRGFSEAFETWYSKKTVISNTLPELLRHIKNSPDSKSIRNEIYGASD